MWRFSTACIASGGASRATGEGRKACVCCACRANRRERAIPPTPTRHLEVIVADTGCTVHRYRMTREGWMDGRGSTRVSQRRVVISPSSRLLQRDRDDDGRQPWPAHRHRRTTTSRLDFLVPSGRVSRSGQGRKPGTDLACEASATGRSFFAWVGLVCRILMQPTVQQASGLFHQSSPLPASGSAKRAHYALPFPATRTRIHKAYLLLVIVVVVVVVVVAQFQCGLLSGVFVLLVPLSCLVSPCYAAFPQRALN